MYFFARGSACRHNYNGDIMKTLVTRITGIIAGMLLSGVSAAQTAPVDTVDKPVSTWRAEIGIGYVKTTGNTDTESLKGDIKAVKEHDKWRHNIKIEGLNTSDSGVTTAERYFVSGKSDYRFSKFNYWYVTAAYDDDHFSGYDYRLSESIGYGRRLLERASLTIDTEIGPGARQSKTDAGEHEDEFLLRLAGNLLWKVSEHSDFSEDLSSEIGEDNTISKSVTALSANINSNLAMKLSYMIKHTSTVPPGIDKTDTETVVTIVYKYK